MYFNLGSLQTLAADVPPNYHLLSELSAALALAGLTEARERWRWWASDGIRPSDEEWDQALAAVDQAISELEQGMLTGAIVLWTTDTIPTGFLLCDGAELNREDYAALFGVLGITYGEGDGLYTFNLPNLTGRFPVGVNTAYTLGETGGEADHTLTVDEIPAHNHGYHRATDVPVTFGEIPGTAAVSFGANTDNTGGGEPHNNMPPYLAVNYIIKT